MLGLIAFILAILFCPKIIFFIVLVILIVFTVMAAMYALALSICDQ